MTTYSNPDTNTGPGSGPETWYPQSSTSTSLSAEPAQLPLAPNGIVSQQPLDIGRQSTPSNSSGVHNSTAVSASASSQPPSGLPQSFANLPPSTQEILKRITTFDNSSSEWGDQWTVARDKVMKSMVSSDAAGSPVSIRGRSKGRPKGTPQNGGHTGASIGNKSRATDSASSTPTRGRGRGGPRGRGRGGGRGRGRGGKRKRDDDTDDEELTPSEEDDDDDDGGSEDESSTSMLPTVTKSGRNVLKPSTFNPAADDSPTSGAKRKRSYARKGPDQIICAKCLRGHSPPSNAIVLCDGCNAAYHQWCHDPVIEREVVDYVDKSWFCGKCTHTKEIDAVPLASRVSGVDMTTQQRSAYLSKLSSETLLALLQHANSLYPDLPIFPPHASPKGPSNTEAKPGSNPTPTTPLPNPIASSSANHTTSDISMRQSTSTTLQAPSTVPQPAAENPEDEDPYPDHSNPWGDPPATYPKPGQGPHRIRPTTDADDLPWLLDDNPEVFSHLIADGQGAMVPLDRSSDWVGKGDVSILKMQAQAGQNGHA